MFTTFVGRDPVSGVSELDGSSPSRPQGTKRAQVARACDWCRVHRAKCDSQHPCSNCQRRGVPCISSAALKSATLPNAYSEIERLRQKVQELESDLQSQTERGSPRPSTYMEGDGNLLRAGREIKTQCEGIHLRTARSQQKTWYGSSSLFYFIGRINAFLTVTFGQDISTQSLMPSTILDPPTIVRGGTTHDFQRIENMAQESIYADEYLTATQEEYFLALFWQTYYATNPIIDEVEFKEHYRSLWLGSSKERGPSALVDIILALCMQYAVSQLEEGTRGLNTNKDATIAGRWYYRRSQTRLTSELESPGLSILQCQLLSCIYLCNASFMNRADNACSQAVRTAYMLGLHLEPPQRMPRRERELRKRLWWAVFVQEAKMSMKLGRPFLLYESSATCALPAHDRDIAMLIGPSYSPPGEGVTWLTCSWHSTKLMLAARSAYTALYYNLSGGCALEGLDEWRKGVPPALKIKRQNNGQSLSTDLSALEIELFAPMWLQRQRLLLELTYHHLCINLHRPSIEFLPLPASPTLPDGSATNCAAHAIALTHIMHQVHLATSILAGWLEAFQWQWNASMSLIGFVLAYPLCPTSTAARNAIDMSIEIFDKYALSFAVAASAADIMRGLSDRLDKLPLRQEQYESPHVYDVANASPSRFDGMQGFDGGTTVEIGGVLGQSIDLLAIEPFQDWE